MEVKTTIKLNQPKELPAEGLTTVKFKPWKNHVVNFLMQDIDNQLFLPGGTYQEWISAASSPIGARGRIIAIRDDDITNNESMLVPFLAPVTLAQVKDPATRQEHTAKMVEAKKELSKKLLPIRNGQLARMIQHIASFVHYTEQDDIDQNSVSLEWIWTYLEQHYNIATKGANFLKITDISYRSGMLPATFYKEYRAGFLDNLRKAGCNEGIKKPGAKLQEDEKLTPSFEDAIVLWALKEIDQRLPGKVRRDYEHRLGDGTYLSDLQATIFQNIPNMLEDLDRQASARALTTQVRLDASWTPTVFPDGRRSTRGRGRGGGGAWGRGAPRGRAAQGDRGRGTGTSRPWYEKFCKVCQVAGKPTHVYTNHNTVDCKPLYAALRTIYIDEPDEEYEEDEEEYGTEYGAEHFDSGRPEAAASEEQDS